MYNVISNRNTRSDDVECIGHCNVVPFADMLRDSRDKRKQLTRQLYFNHINSISHFRRKQVENVRLVRVSLCIVQVA